MLRGLGWADSAGSAAALPASAAAAAALPASAAAAAAPTADTGAGRGRFARPGAIGRPDGGPRSASAWPAPCTTMTFLPDTLKVMRPSSPSRSTTGFGIVLW